MFVSLQSWENLPWDLRGNVHLSLIYCSGSIYHQISGKPPSITSIQLLGDQIWGETSTDLPYTALEASTIRPLGNLHLSPAYSMYNQIWRETSTYCFTLEGDTISVDLLNLVSFTFFLLTFNSKRFLVYCIINVCNLDEALSQTVCIPLLFHFFWVKIPIMSP